MWELRAHYYADKEILAGCRQIDTRIPFEYVGGRKIVIKG